MHPNSASYLLSLTGDGALVCNPLSQVVLKHSSLARNNASGSVVLLSATVARFRYCKA